MVKIAGVASLSVFFPTLIILYFQGSDWSSIWFISGFVCFGTFIIGINVLAFFFVPRSTYPSVGLNNPEITTHPINTFSDQPRNDWYNDVTNPISPIYQTTHQSTQQSLSPTPTDSISRPWN